MSAVLDFLLDLILDWDDIPSYEHLAVEERTQYKDYRPLHTVPQEYSKITYTKIAQPETPVVRRSPEEHYYDEDMEYDRRYEEDMNPEYPFHDFNYGP